MHYIYVNPFFEKIHNLKLKDVIGKHFIDVIGEDGFQNNLKHYEKVIKGEIVKYDSCFPKLDGNLHHYNAIYTPLKDKKENVIGFTGVVVDITAQKELEILAITDSLTNLYNRRHFNELFPKMINSAKRNNDLVSFIIMDIDYFKQYNDTYGHQMGDDVLIKVAKAIKISLHRADDYCFRLGGEEFGVIFKAFSQEKALDFSNKIKESIENLHINHSGNSASPYVTASMGLICKNANDIKNSNEVYKEADKLLYKAKDSGRNNVEYS